MTFKIDNQKTQNKEVNLIKHNKIKDNYYDYVSELKTNNTITDQQKLSKTTNDISNTNFPILEKDDDEFENKDNFNSDYSKYPYGQIPTINSEGLGQGQGQGQGISYSKSN